MQQINRVVPPYGEGWPMAHGKVTINDIDVSGFRTVGWAQGMTMEDASRLLQYTSIGAPGTGDNLHLKGALRSLPDV